MPFGSSLPPKIFVFFKVAPPFVLTRSCYSARVTDMETAERMMRMACSFARQEVEQRQRAPQLA